MCMILSIFYCNIYCIYNILNKLIIVMYDIIDIIIYIQLACASSSPYLANRKIFRSVISMTLNVCYLLHTNLYNNIC